MGEYAYLLSSLLSQCSRGTSEMWVLFMDFGVFFVRNLRYDMFVCCVILWMCPVQWEYNRLNLNYTVTSKRKVGLHMENCFFLNFFFAHHFRMMGGIFLEVKILKNFDPIWGFHPNFFFKIHNF